MMFADNGAMLLEYVLICTRSGKRLLINCSGNFADELGEDFLGLRDLGIAQEHGLSSLTVPASVFYGRRKRAADAGQLGFVSCPLSDVKRV
jgi:transcriptional activator SPT7